MAMSMAAPSHALHRMVALRLVICAIVASMTLRAGGAAGHWSALATPLLLLAGAVALALALTPRVASNGREARLLASWTQVTILDGAAVLSTMATASDPALSWPAWLLPYWPSMLPLALFMAGSMGSVGNHGSVGAMPGTTLLIAGRTVLLALAGWPAGGAGPVAVAGGIALLSAAVQRFPWWRPAATSTALALSGKAGRTNLEALAPRLAGSEPLTEGDIRAAAAMLDVDSCALVINEPSRRTRQATAQLLLLQNGVYAQHRVVLASGSFLAADTSPGTAAGAAGGASTAVSPALGFFPPAGFRMRAPLYVHTLHGQSGELGQLLIPDTLSTPGTRTATRTGAQTSPGAQMRDALVALLSAHWSLRLDNVRLGAEAESRLLDIVESLITSVEAKDFYTSGHSKRVCKYSVLIAEALGITGRELDDVAIGAALHDVGKLGIPEQVLGKPSKLEDSEWQLMKSHPKVGARIIDSFNQSQVVLDMIVFHHERWDGKGYPAALRGEDIPFHARIVGVADALDAMTSGRSYQRNRTVPDALEEVRLNAGKQFDPRVVEAILRVPLASLEAITPEIPAPAAAMASPAAQTWPEPVATTPIKVFAVPQTMPVETRVPALVA